MLLVGITLAFVGCGRTDSDRFSKVDYGMSREEVREIMGEPDIVRKEKTGDTCWGWGGSEQPPRGPSYVACFDTVGVIFLLPPPESQGS
jgi:hypothetical protein